MITDAYNTFADKTPMAAGVVGNVLDTAQNYIGPTDLYLVVSFPQKPAGAGTVQFKLVVSATPNVDPASATVVSISPELNIADVEAGDYAMRVGLPAGMTERYMAFVVEGNPTGTVNASLAVDPPAWHAFEEGQN